VGVVTEVVDAFFRAIEQSDVGALQRIYDEELRVWHNFDGLTQNKSQNIETLANVVTHTRRIEYVVQERIVLGDRVAQRHQMHITTLSGKSLEIPAVIFLTVRDGRISRIEEYLDRTQLNPLYAELSKIAG
jgi:ketosteroid isomerase-like protein